MRDRRSAIRTTQLFSSKSATARVWLIRDRVYGASYSGPMSEGCFDKLRAMVIAATHDAVVLLIRMDRALMVATVAPPIPQGTYRLNQAPAVVIVRPDQFAVWYAYSVKMADLGIRRVVFLDSQAALAHRLVDQLAEAQSEPHSQHSKPLFV